ncbi:hypothetical protein ACMSZN_000567 [Cronobacter dublinensis]
MDIRYPVRKADGRDYKNYNELLTDICKNTHGWWLLGVNRYWHGGIHIGASSSPASVLNQDMPEKSVPLQFMMDGEVVAWRVNRDYANSGRHACRTPTKIVSAETRAGAVRPGTAFTGW